MTTSGSSGAPRRRPRSRHRQLVLLRRRLAAAAIAAVLVGLAFSALRAARPDSTGHRASRAATTVPTTGPLAPPHLVTSISPWQLPAPVSRTVAMPLDGRLSIFGGLGPGNVTTAGIIEVDPTSGKASQIGTLDTPTHDSAGAILGNRYFVFGGGAQTVSAKVQAFAPDQPGTAAPQASIVGALPSPRADLAAATAAGSALLVGGYDGATASPAVLQTSDGTAFSVVGQLPVPVRYPAVSVLGDTLCVVGDDLAAGRADTTAIQTVDLRTHATAIAGHMALGISHASAVTLGNSLYVLGGRSGGHASDTVSILDPATATLKQVGVLPVATSDMAAASLGETAYLVGGEGEHGQPVRSVFVARLVRPAASTRATGSAAGAGKAPFDGRLLIADRGNNRLLLVGADKQIQWSFPSPTAPAPPQGFYFPDDAFFARAGTAIITNEEEQHTIIELAFPSGQVIASYGHPNLPGRAPGYLNQSRHVKNPESEVTPPPPSLRGQLGEGTTGRCFERCRGWGCLLCGRRLCGPGGGRTRSGLCWPPPRRLRSEPSGTGCYAVCSRASRVVLLAGATALRVATDVPLVGDPWAGRQRGFPPAASLRSLPGSPVP
jgi:hypothetical protein